MGCLHQPSSSLFCVSGEFVINFLSVRQPITNLEMTRTYTTPFLLSAAILSAQTVSKPVNPFGNKPESISAGRNLFNSSCTNCHGRDGGEGQRGPALAANRRYFRLSDAAIFDAIQSGIVNSPMPAMGLSDDDTWRIVSFIRSLRATASESSVPGDVARGRLVFEGKGKCTECHMLQGRGGLLGPDLSNVGGERSLGFIRDSLTLPIPPEKGFRPVKVFLATGGSLEGIARNEDSFSLQLLSPDGRLHLLTADEIHKIERSEVSLMPKNYDRVLDAAEFQDLVAFLSRQVVHRVKIVQQGENEIGR